MGSEPRLEGGRHYSGDWRMNAVFTEETLSQE